MSIPQDISNVFTSASTNSEKSQRLDDWKHRSLSVAPAYGRAESSETKPVSRASGLAIHHKSTGSLWLLGSIICLCHVSTASAQEHNKPQQKPALAPTGTIELTVTRGMALAHISINGKPMLFMVDSGSETTFINLDRMALPIKRDFSSGIVTITGRDVSRVWKVVNISSMKLGQVEIRNLEAVSRSLASVENDMKMEVDGILGSDLLNAWDSVQLDYRAKVMSLGGCKTRGPDRGADSNCILSPATQNSRSD